VNQRDLAKAANDPAFFRSKLIIDADGMRKAFTPDRWQDADFRAMDAGWLRCAGRGGASEAKLRHWLERPRGHAKSADLAVMCAWCLLFGMRPLKIIGAAGDKDQAGLLRAAIETLARLNPWVAAVLQIDNWRITNSKTGAELEIISSDAATSFGALPDAVICDEVCHWPEGRGEALWESLLSAAAKRRDCMCVVISNAGWTQSWQWKLREKVRIDPAWHFSRLEAPVASWITRERLAEQERLLPTVAFRRLWLNEWTSGAGDALTEADVEAACVLGGPDTDWNSGWEYFAGCDLGLRRDKAAVAIVGIDRQNVAHLVHLRTWSPSLLAGAVGKREIDLAAIEGELRRLSAAWRLRSILADQWQAAQLVQGLQKDGLPAESVAYTLAVLTEVATCAIERFRDRSIRLWRDAQLVKDLVRLRLEERAGGYRLVSPRGADGHGDSVSALLLALLGAKRSPPRLTISPNTIFMIYRSANGTCKVVGPEPDYVGIRKLERYDPPWCAEVVRADGTISGVVSDLWSPHEAALTHNLSCRRVGLREPNALVEEIPPQRVAELEARLDAAR
jgi:phage terminase large subunit-like protein